MHMNIDIICPLYNAEKYIENLHHSFLVQKKVNIKSINYALTRSDDKTEEILKSLNANYELIEPSQFSHSLTREYMAKKSSADIIVFVSQDVKILRDDWLYYLTEDIIKGNCDAAYSRQIAEKNNIEKYTREKNYGNISFIKEKKDLTSMGLNTFFFSDASSAIKRDIFEQLNYYDGKTLSSNEDQYIAYKLIMSGYKIKYCAESEVIHSHLFNFKTLFKRYQDTGDFYRSESYLNDYGTYGAGADLAVYILKRIIEERNWYAAIEFIPNMLARFLGMKIKKRGQ